MKKLFLITILLFASQLFATDYYISPGGDNGAATSWATAKTTFANFSSVWSSVNPGDNIYIDGGTDSTIYYETLQPQCRGTAENRITIIAGKYSPSPSGHSGRVIIDGGAVRGASIFFDDYAGTAPTYITVKGFETRYADGGVAANIDAARGVSRGCIVDSCRITNFYGLAGIYYKGHFDSSVVQNCYIKTMNTPGQTDCFHYNGANNGTYHPILNIIHDNFIDNTNQDLLAHNDAIQGVDGEGYLIYNNIVINDSVWSTEGGGLPFIVTSNDWDNDNYPPNIWFNNYCYMGGPWYPNASPGFAMWNRHDGGAGGGNSAPSFIFNNTIVANGPGIGCFDNQFRVDLFVNNIIAQWCQDSPVDYRTGGTPWASSHTGADNQSVMTDAGASFPPNDALANLIIHNISDSTDDGVADAGSVGIITANTSTTITVTLSGGGDNDWDTGDSYTIPVGRGQYSGFGSNINYGVYEQMDSIRSNLFWKEDSTESYSKIINSGGWFELSGGGGPTQIVNWDDWVSKGGTGSFTDPLFVNNIGRESNQSALVPDIKVNSPAIDAGEDLSELYNYFISEFGIDLPEMLNDIYGNPRDASWDIGAVEYQSTTITNVNGVTSPTNVNGVTSPTKINGIEY